MKKVKLSYGEIGRFCQEMAYLMHAGIRTADALALLADDEERTEIKTTLSAMAERVDRGESLTESFSAAGCFPEYICSMVGAGEKSGRTEEALSSLAENCEQRAELDRRLRSALLYPSVLLLIMLAVIAVLLIYVLPIFNDVYAQLGSTLTGVAGGLLRFGQVLGTLAPVLLAVFGAAVVILTLFAFSAEFRDAMLSRWQRRGGGDKGLSGKLNKARFAQAMSMCFGSGMPLESAIRHSAKLLPEASAMNGQSDKCLELMAQGQGLAQSLLGSGLLPASECRLLEAGVRGGAGERAMEQIAQHLTEDAEAAVDEAISRVEPTMVVITSVLVGAMLLSVMLPLINIMSAIA